MENKPPKQTTLPGTAGQACLYCRMIKREEPACIVYEDQNSIAFLDTRPLFPGHVLLIPKVHYENIDEMPGDIMGLLFKNVKFLSNAVESGMNSDGSFIAVNNKVSQSIRHLHIHIVPRRFGDGLKGFFWPRYKYKSMDEMQQIQEKIVKALKY